MIRVLVVDDSVFMRTVLAELLAKDPDIDVVGTASDGRDALVKIEELAPDVVTLDIQMPNMDGLATLEALSSKNHGPKVLMLSSLAASEAEITQKALSLGADDFMLKPRNLSILKTVEPELTTKIKHLLSIPPTIQTDAVVSDPARCAVLVGSSAGGPPMLDMLVSSLKPELRASFVITQHMPEGFTAALAHRLNRVSALPVHETQNGEILKCGNILVSRGGYHTVISETLTPDGRHAGRVVHSRSPPLHAVRPAVDTTFSSGAKAFGDRTISVLLSGMGRDGGEGMRAVKDAGGTTIVVREEDCLVYGMARSALETGSVDMVVPFKDLPGRIMKAVARIGG
ncbi:MAG: chemotaxis-specific protein-glutamate methyltransferase CheB [Methanomicrobiaceae archaeon]|nr:chemotaxis-specific protein-glutamate methyltransferase CheB [Methanomicrobiaceae archaeon]